MTVSFFGAVFKSLRYHLSTPVKECFQNALFVLVRNIGRNALKSKPGSALGSKERPRKGVISPYFSRGQNTGKILFLALQIATPRKRLVQASAKSNETRVTLYLHLHYSTEPPHPKKQPVELLRRREVFLSFS